MEETIHAIACLTRANYNTLITVKKIRELYDIDSLNYSKVNFYWRNLQFLEQIGILKRINTKSPKMYKVLNYFKFFELLHNSYSNQANLTEAF
jgi:hypothetical protein